MCYLYVLLFVFIIISCCLLRFNYIGGSEEFIRVSFVYYYSWMLIIVYFV